MRTYKVCSWLVTGALAAWLVPGTHGLENLAAVGGVVAFASVFCPF
ncbi:hypothetical protein B0G73_105225 [Paraburkholderia sp. BL25I1N1]|nr:hypothetical protein B0G73_105225 [Paraburkholderia sp. BL25I1N1]